MVQGYVSCSIPGFIFKIWLNTLIFIYVTGDHSVLSSDNEADSNSDKASEGSRGINSRNKPYESRNPTIGEILDGTDGSPPTVAELLDDDDDESSRDGDGFDIDKAISEVLEQKEKEDLERKEKIEKLAQSRNPTFRELLDEEYEDDDSSSDFGISEGLERKTALEDFDKMVEENGKTKRKKKRKQTQLDNVVVSDPKTNVSTKQSKKRRRAEKKQNKAKRESQLESKKISDKDVEVDPTNVFTMDSKLSNINLPSSVLEEEEDEQRMTIAQAFAEDDVIEEFSKEKREVVKEDMPKDINLVLPGWGEWGGEGVKVSKKKKKRFIFYL